MLLDRAVGSTIKAIVSITDQAVERWDAVPEAQGALMVSELGEAGEPVRAIRALSRQCAGEASTTWTRSRSMPGRRATSGTRRSRD